MPVDVDFNTKPEFVRRQGRKILGPYPEEKLARKMVQAGHVIRIPEPSYTIDAETYDHELASRLDWNIIFDIDDGRRYWIAVPEFNQRKVFLDRGRGPQWRIAIKYLHRDDDSGPFTYSGTSNLMPPAKPKAPQLSLWGES